MANRPTAASVTATIVAAVLGVLGAWASWVRKRPAGYVEGQPYYTSEEVTGLETGFRGIDPLLVLLAVAVVAAVVLARRRNLRPDLSLVGVGTLMLLVFADPFHTYWSSGRYAVGPGLYLLLASGLLFVLVGLRSRLDRRKTVNPDDSSGPRTG